MEIKLYHNDGHDKSFNRPYSIIRIDNAYYTYLGSDDCCYYYEMTVNGQKIADSVSDTEPCDLWINGMFYGIKQSSYGPTIDSGGIQSRSERRDEVGKISSICTGENFSVTFPFMGSLGLDPSKQMYFAFRNCKDYTFRDLALEVMGG